MPNCCAAVVSARCSAVTGVGPRGGAAVPLSVTPAARRAASSAAVVAAVCAAMAAFKALVTEGIAPRVTKVGPLGPGTLLTEIGGEAVKPPVGL